MTVPYFNSSGLNTPKPVGPLIPTFPFQDEGDGVTRVWRQAHEVKSANYTRPALSTVHPTLSPFAYFVGDEPGTFKRGGILIFNRVWANIPAQRIVPSDYTYEFIGIQGSPFQGISTRRRFTQTVDAKITFDYYLPGVTGGVTTIDDIPRVQRQRYFRSVEEWRDLDFVGFNTTPGRSQYLDWIDSGEEIVAEDSRRNFWMGEIVERRVIRIRAQ